MGQEDNNNFKQFEADVSSEEEAADLIGRFYRKFGNFAGSDYFCAEATIDGQPGGPYAARIGFVLWPYQIPAEERVDFDKLAEEAEAREIVN
jgi:hypothetical protein